MTDDKKQCRACTILKFQPPCPEYPYLVAVTDQLRNVKPNLCEKHQKMVDDAIKMADKIRSDTIRQATKLSGR